MTNILFSTSKSVRLVEDLHIIYNPPVNKPYACEFGISEIELAKELLH